MHEMIDKFKNTFNLQHLLCQVAEFIFGFIQIVIDFY